MVIATRPKTRLMCRLVLGVHSPKSKAHLWVSALLGWGRSPPSVIATRPKTRLMCWVGMFNVSVLFVLTILQMMQPEYATRPLIVNEVTD